jgi:hypothetical protein
VLPIHDVFNGSVKFFQDITAPYYQFCHAKYESYLNEYNNESSSFIVSSTLTKTVFNKTTEQINFRIIGNETSLQKIEVETEKESFEINLILQ